MLVYASNFLLPFQIPPADSRLHCLPLSKDRFQVEIDG